MTFDLAAAAGEFGQELQQLLDAVLPYENGADPELRQVTTMASGLTFAVEALREAIPLGELTATG